MEGKYLSEVVDFTSIQTGCLNLIEAPCGAGKTTFALKTLPQEFCDPSRSLYLIDTVAGMEQLLKNSNCKCYDKDFLDVVTCFSDPTNDKLTVITYAKFGSLCKKNPQWYLDLDTIICDEMHSLVDMRKWTEGEDDNLHQLAWDALMECVDSRHGPTVIALTGTSAPLFNAMGGHARISPDTKKAELYSPRISRVKCTERPRRYRPKKVEHYSNLTMLCNTVLPTDKKGIIYTSHITTIKRCIKLLQDRGINAIGIWSTHNAEHPLSEEQLEVRKSIINNEAIPDDVDVLFINKSCETSINIKSHVDYMVINTLDSTSKFQAMGRYRDDLDLVYIKRRIENEEFTLPENLLNRKLYKKDIDEYILANNLRTQKGRLMGAPTFLKMLEAQGYIVKANKEQGGQRYHIIMLE